MRKIFIAIVVSLFAIGIQTAQAKQDRFVSLAYVWLHHLKMDKLTAEQVAPTLDRYNWNGISDVALIGGAFMAGQDATVVTAWNRATWPPVAEGKDYRNEPLDEQGKRERLCSKEVLKAVVQYYKKKGIKVRLCEQGYGWLAGGSLSVVVKDPVKTKRYAEAMCKLAKELDCNGLDFDWEFPTTAEEAEGYRLLMREVKRRGFLVSVCAIQPTVDRTYMDNCFPDDAAVNNHVGKYMKWEKIINEGIADEINVMQYLAYNPERKQMDVNKKMEKMSIWEKAFPNEFTAQRKVKLLCGVGYYSFMLPEAKVGKKIKGKGTLNFPALYEKYGNLAYTQRNIRNEHTVWTTRDVRDIVRQAKERGWGGVFTWVVSHDFTIDHPTEFNRQQALADEVERIWKEDKKSQLHVSTQGNDKNPGTAKRPLRTVQAALAKAQKVKAPYEVEILLHKGRYELSKALVVNRSHTTLKAFGDGEVILSGGRFMAPSKLKQVQDETVRRRLQPQVRNRVVEIDFTQQGLPMDGLHAVGFGRPSIAAWPEPFVEGCAMHVARWPNDTTLLIGRIVEAGEKKEGQQTAPNGIFGYKSNRPSLWKDTKQLWIGGYFAHGYADDMIRVAKVDTVQKLIYAGEPTVYGFKTGAKFRRWYALNLPEELDAPGEYVLDAQHKKMYILLPEGKEKEGLHLSVIDKPLLTVKNCAFVNIEGLTFEYGRGIGVYTEKTHAVTIDGCTLRNLGGTAVVMGQGTLSKDGVLDHKKGGELASGVVGNLNSTIYENILLNRHAGTDNGVKNCHIYAVGAGGVNMGGGDRTTLMPAGNFVENCRIHNFNRIEKSYKPGVWIDGVGNRVSNCEIYDAPSMAILFNGNEHTIEFCDIHDVCSEIDDQGAVYYGRDVAALGNVVRYCYIHHLAKEHMVAGVYHDDGACGLEVNGNIFYKAGMKNSLIGGGHYNHYHGNLFLCSPQGVHVDARMTNWGAFMIKRGAVIDERLQKVRYQEPPYSTAYPWLPSYWEKNPAVPHNNIVNGNLFYKVDNMVDGKSCWLELYNNWSTTEDPGFVDSEQPLKGFVKDAPIYRYIKDFEKIPFQEIGCKLPQRR